MLETLQAWVTSYYERTDCWSHAAHRALFDAFEGRKIEHTSPGVRRPDPIPMDTEAFFWKIMRNELPPPRVAETLGIRFLSVDGEAGVVEVEFQARPEFTNPAGNIQGGFLAAMLDDTMGPALSATLAAGQFAPTLNLNVSFQRPAVVGTLVGKGRVVRKGKDVCFLAAELYQGGQQVASATATAIIRMLPR